MKDVTDQYRDTDGQPKLTFDDVRVAMDMRLCEPNAPLLSSWAMCPGNECGRVASRNVGDDPWVKCVCGMKFNMNFSVFGRSAWPEPLNGEPIKVPANGLRALDSIRSKE